MISITDIKAGWALLNIGSCSFCVSYLSDVKEDIEELINFDDSRVNYVFLEGEDGGDLLLIAYLTNCDKDINIVWQDLYNKQEKDVHVFKYPYSKFVNEWYMMCKKIKEDYIRNFICVQDEREYKEYAQKY